MLNLEVFFAISEILRNFAAQKGAFCSLCSEY